MNNQLNLIDIEGVEISFWPLAIGYWVLIIAFLLLIIAIIFYKIKQNKFKQSWQFLCLNKLENLNSISSDKKLSELSKIVRLIAINKFGRKKCAGLKGNDWLTWLEQNDPNNFKWKKYATCLITQNYSPNKNIDDQEFKLITNAIKGWIK